VAAPLPKQAQPETDDASDAAEATSGGIERRRHPRIRLENAEPDAIATGFREAERRQGERRQGDRRQAGALRDNVGWTVADRTRVGGRQFRMKKSQVIVLGIAVVAGGIAFYLASQVGRPAPSVAAAAPVAAATQVLVASQQIGAGQRLTASALAWQPWPDQALQPDYVTAATPDAKAEMVGMMARSEFLPGDPIRKQKLTQGGGGFLSAALDKGMRGVSVVVTAQSASGGFVSPGDRVDVVLTRGGNGDFGGKIPRSETILRGVQVLAINSRAVEPGSVPAAPDEQRGNTFEGEATATLALDSASADLVISASAFGKLSLLLRSVVDTAGADAKPVPSDHANQTIRMTSPFWLQ
jgi:pilus assembly protein CpaB